MPDPEDTSFYSRLFGVGRSDDSRLPREDFLTEILVELLGQMLRAEDGSFESFFRKVLLSRCSNEDNFQAFIGQLKDFGSEVEIVSQFNAEGGRPDIALKRDGVGFCFIENKIGASFTESGASEGEEAGNKGHQLSRYESFLSHAGDATENSSDQDKVFSGLILLTQYTPAPERFLEDDARRIHVREVAYWSQVAAWIDERLSKFESSSMPAWGFTAMEFCKLLREWKMTTTEPTLSDLAAARLFLVEGGSGRLVASMKEVRNLLRSELSDSYKLYRDYPKYQDDHRLIDGMVVRSEKTEIDWSLLFHSERPGTEALFPDNFRPDAAEQDFVTFRYWFTRTPNGLEQNSIEDGWVPDLKPKKHPEWAYLLRYSDARELLNSEKGFTRAMVEWIVESFNEAKEMMENAN